jgi:hypothetical protein
MGHGRKIAWPRSRSSQQRSSIASAVTREHGRLVGNAQRAAEEALRGYDPDSPRVKVTLPRVAFLEAEDGEPDCRRSFPRPRAARPRRSTGGA